GLDLPPPLRAGDLLSQAPAVVDEHAELDRVGMGVVGEIGLLTDHLDEVTQPAVIFGQVARRQAGILRHLGQLLGARVMDTIQPRNTMASVNRKKPSKTLQTRTVPSHPFRIREIAVQAGLSEATVDRV